MCDIRSTPAVAGLLLEETRPELATAQSSCCHPLKAPVNNNPGNSWDSLEEEVTGVALKGQAPVGVAGESWAGMRAADTAQGPGHWTLPPQLRCPPKCLCCLCPEVLGCRCNKSECSEKRENGYGLWFQPGPNCVVPPPPLSGFLSQRSGKVDLGWPHWSVCSVLG